MVDKAENFLMQIWIRHDGKINVRHARYLLKKSENLTAALAQLKKVPSDVSLPFFEKKFKLVLEQFWKYCEKTHVQGYLVSKWADIVISCLFMKDFQNFWTKISPKLAKFIQKRTLKGAAILSPS